MSCQDDWQEKEACYVMSTWSGYSRFTSQTNQLRWALQTHTRILLASVLKSTRSILVPVITVPHESRYGFVFCALCSTTKGSVLMTTLQYITNTFFKLCISMTWNKKWILVYPPPTHTHTSNPFTHTADVDGWLATAISPLWGKARNPLPP